MICKKLPEERSLGYTHTYATVRRRASLPQLCCLVAAAREEPGLHCNLNRPTKGARNVHCMRDGRPMLNKIVLRILTAWSAGQFCSKPCHDRVFLALTPHACSSCHAVIMNLRYYHYQHSVTGMRTAPTAEATVLSCEARECKGS